ncbi:alpha/beta-hydrolase [Gymnopus androsaceus JB14]|uniref:Carboxylic ester hydrolase n=1 Tax=Gymnopus androsaceus JB14 TaxID=1447944 RepID=A0A6A4HZ06_9AGAR|nr:alpha/beta-hydrolase [Gymnopus androsaceus JB14]
MTLLQALASTLTIVCIVSAQQNHVIPISGHLSQSGSSTNGSSDGLTVLTQQGPVVGTSPIVNVRQFLAPFNASSFGDSCPQQFNDGDLEFLRLSWGGLSDEQIFVSESEDCLNVNIWAPSINRAQSTAVLVWIYGGALAFGTSNTPQYNGLNIVRDNDDITLVSFNYRTNIFGLPNAPQLNGTGQAQNFAFLDVDAAIQWVYQNIEYFGGDPERITIFGQSAGAELADAYTLLMSFTGVIEQSGSALGNTEIAAAKLTINDIAWNAVASAVGCGNTTDSVQFSCMQNVSTIDLSAAVSNTSQSFNVVVDGVTTFADTAARATSGRFLKVPVLAGTVANEGDIFIAIAQLLAVGAIIQPGFDILSSIYTMNTSCPTAETTAFRAAAGSTVFRYEYQAIFPNMSPFPQLRAYHTSEIPLVFGTYNVSRESLATTQTGIPVPSTNTEIALSKAMQRAWVAFAQDPQNGLPSIGWPVYNTSASSPTIATLGNYLNATGWSFHRVGGD